MKTSEVSFKARYNTVDILGVTTQRVLRKGGMTEITRIVNTLNDKKAVGGRGIKVLAEKVGKQITAKYPKIKTATDRISLLYKEAKGETPKNLSEVLKDITEKLGQEIDIIL